MTPTPSPAEPLGDAPLVAARDAAVVCDIAPLCVLAVAGPDAETFLQGQLSADIAGMPAGECRHASFNSPKGRMLATVVVWRDRGTSDRFLVLVPQDIASSVAKRLAMYVLRAKVAIGDVSDTTPRVGLGGPAAGEALRDAFGATPGCFARWSDGSSTILGLPGGRYVVMPPAERSEATRAALMRSATAASYEVWEWLTVRAGVPVVTGATQDLFVAQAANWDLLGGIDFRKGCYTGQEIIARTQYLGRLKERLFAFHVDGPVPAPGARLYSSVYGAQPCGTVVNAAAAPGGGHDFVAVLQIAAADRGDARLGAADGPVISPLPLPYAIPAAVAARR